MATTFISVKSRIDAIARQFPNKDVFAEHVRGMRGLVAAVFDPRTPSFELGLERVRETIVKGPLFSLNLVEESVPAEFRTAEPTLQHLTVLSEELSALLFERGYRELTSMLTTQEHLMIGSTQIGDMGNPFVPVGILSGSLSISEVQVARRLQGFFLASVLSFVGLDRSDSMLVLERTQTRASLEPLDSGGRVLRDPQVVVPIEGELIPFSEYPLPPKIPSRLALR